MGDGNFYNQTRERFLGLADIVAKTRDIAALMEWLDKKTDFYYAPASTNYHSNFEAGLAFHSANVAEILVELTGANKLRWDDPASPILIGLFHDLCKIFCYAKERKSRKTGEFYPNGKPIWEDVDAYVYDCKNPVGDHGDKSLILLMEHARLTDEEKAAIRWHMGPPEGYTAQMAFLAATKKWPNILWTNMADRLAAIEEDS